jgi:glycosyltransferase involved in cell wall biosynthesis
MENIESPTVSVIIPAYNRAYIIGRSMQSVLDQTYKDFELIIVDDGSSDNTEEVVRAFNDQRIRYIKHASNRGVSAARNTGIKAARGKYIAFQDSDDEWLPQKLEKQMALFEQDTKGDLGLVVCEAQCIREGRKTRSTPNANWLNYEQLISHIGESGIGAPRFLLKRNLAAPELYFDESLRSYEDWDLMCRLSRICRIDYVKNILFRWYFHNNPHVFIPRNRIEARNALLLKYAGELKVRPKALSYVYRHNALDCHQLGQMGEMRRYLKASIKTYPWNPDLYLNYIVSLCGRRFFKFFLRVRHYVLTLLHLIKSLLARLYKITT